MNTKTKSFRVSSMNSRVKLAAKNAGKYWDDGTFGFSTTYQAWHKGYNAAVRDIRKALKAKS